MNSEEKILNLLGFAARARKTLYGKDNIKNYVKNAQKNKIVVIAFDTGETIKKEIIDKCCYYNVPYIILSKNKTEIGHILGKDEISVIGITDENFVKGVLDIVKIGGEIKCQKSEYTN